MLSSMVSTASMMSSATAISTLTAIGVSEMSMMAIICLIALLCIGEVLSASKRWNKNAARTFNMAILPLCMAFVAIAAFKIMELV